MSREIDERVVQMKFESGQFEKNIQTSIHSLEELKKGLDFKDASKGFEALDSASNRVNIDPITQAVQQLNSHFNLFGITAINVMNRISNAAINTGEKLLKSLTIDQLTPGWGKYEDKTSSVQTIMAATSKQFTNTAEQMAVVNEQLNKLNWFTDETSYNFVDMVNNIGKFTSNNIGLEQSVTAMQGIANWAAISGANANEASRAMYNLAQALATGTVKLIDWKSIENANMATTEFKQTVIDIAEAEGTLIKVSDDLWTTLDKKTQVSVSNFNEGLSKGWFTKDVLMKALDRYGAATNKLNEITEKYGMTASSLIRDINKYTAAANKARAESEALGETEEETQKRIKEATKDTIETIASSWDDATFEDVEEALAAFDDELMQFGLKSFKAAQEAKTFTEAINSVKDAVSTGWMKSYELIFGDYINAKEFWTDIANTLYDIFAASGDARNEMLQVWSDRGGREYFTDAIYAGLAAILSILNPIKAAWESVFGKMTAYKLTALTGRLQRLMVKLIASEDTMQKIARVFRGVFSVLDLIRTVIAELVGGLLQGFQRIMAAIGVDVGEFAASAGDVVYYLTQWIKQSGIVRTAVNALVDIIVKAIGNIKNFIKQLSEWGPAQNAVEIFKKIAVAAFAVIGDAIYVLIDVFYWLYQQLQNFHLPTSFSEVGQFFSDLAKKVGESFEKIGLQSDTLGKGFGVLGNIIKSTVGTIVSVFALAANGVSSVMELFASYADKIDWAGVLLAGYGVAMIALLWKLVTAMNSFATSLANVTGVGKQAGNAFKAITTYFNTLTTSVQTNSILKTAIAIAMLAAACGILAQMDWKGVLAGGAAIAMIAGAVSLLTFTFEKLEVANGLTGGKGIVVLVQMVAAMAAAIAILAIALNFVPTGDDIKERMTTLGIALVALATTATIFSWVAKPIQIGAASLVGIAASVAVMIMALKTIKPEDAQQILQTLPVVSAIMLVMAALTRLMSVTSKTVTSGGGIMTVFKQGSGFMSILGLVLSLHVMISAIKSLAKLRPDEAVTGIMYMIPLIIGVNMLLKHIIITAKNAASAGKMVMYIALTINLLYFAMKTLASMDRDELIKGGLAVGAMLAVIMILTKVTAISNKLGANSAKVGIMVLEIAAALALLQLVVKTLGKMDPVEALIGVASVSVLLIAIGKMLRGIGKSMDTNLLGLQALTKITIIVGILSAIVIALTYIDPIGSFAVTVGLAALFAALAALFKTIRKLDANATASIGAVVKIMLMATILGGVVGGIAALADDWKAALAATVGIGIVLVALGAMMRIADKTSGGLTGKKFLPMAGIVVVIGGVIAGLVWVSHLWKDVDAKTLQIMIQGLAEVMVAFGAMSGIMGSMVGKPTMANLAPLAAMVIGAGLLIAELAVLSHRLDIDWKEMAALVAGISVLMAVMAGISRLLLTVNPIATMAPGLVPTMVTVGLFMIALGGMLAILASIKSLNPDALVPLAVSIGVLLVEMTAIVAASDFFAAHAASMTAAFPAIGIAGGLIAALGSMLVLFSNWNTDPNTLLPLAGGITLLAIAMVVACGALAVAGVAASVALPGLGVILAVIAAIGAVMAAIIFINDKVEGALGGKIADAVPMMADLGEGIGKFIGSIVGGIAAGFLEATAEGFEEASAHLATAMNDEHMGGVFTALKEKMPENILELGKRLVDLVSTIASPAFKTNILALKDVATIMLENSENLKTVFTTFGEALNAFAEACGDIDMDGVANGVDAASQLTTLEANLPAKGGLMQTLLGEDDLKSFGERLAVLGVSLVLFSHHGALIDTKGVSNAASASKKLVDIESNLPAKNGRLQEFLGQDGFDKFGERLVSYGAALVHFSDAVSGQAEGSTGIAPSAIDKAITATRQLADIEKNIQTVGGFGSGWLFATADLGRFGQRLVDYGDALVSYSDMVSENIDLLSIRKSVRATELLNDLEGTLNTHGGWDSFWNGDNTFGQFGTNLKGLGVALNSFSINISKIEWANIDTAIGYIERMMAFEKLEEASNQTLDMTKKLMTNIVEVIKAQKKPIKDEAHDMAYWLADGFALGMVDYEEIALAAARKLAQAIIDVMNMIFKIRSPSVVMNEMGHWVVKGLGEGITEDMSAEEAAEQKAQDIITAFQNELSKMSTKLDISDLEYQLWQKTDGATASESDKAKKELEQEVEKLKAKAQEVSMMRTAMNAVLETAGEESEAYQTAYKNYLQSQIDMYDQKATVDELQRDVMGTTSNSWADQAKKFAQLQADNAEAFKFMGKTEEELREWAAEQVGAGFKRQLQTNELLEEYRDAFDRLGYSQEQRIAEVDKMLGPETVKEVETAFQDTNAIIEEAMKNTSYTLEMAVSKSVSGAIGSGSASGASIGAEDLTGNVTDSINKAMEEIQEKTKMEGFFGLENQLSFLSDPGKITSQMSDFFNGENGILSAFKRESQPITDAVGGWFTDMTSSIFGKEKVEEWKDGAKSFLGKDGVQGGLEDTEAVAAVEGSAEKVPDAANTAMQDAAKNEDGTTIFYEDGANATTEVSEGMEDPTAIAAVTNSGETVANDAHEPIKAEVPKLEESGKNATFGFAKGLTNEEALNKVRESSRKVAAVHLETLQQVLDEASPSKATAKIGGYASEGLAIGILSKKSMVVNSSEEIANASLTALDYTKDLINDVLANDEDFNPTITPVLDLDQLTADAKSIPNLLGRNSTLNLSSTARRANQINSSIAQNRQNGIDNPNQTNYNFTQNNYSPKSLNRVEIYRQTQNQFAQLKGATKIR